MSQLRRLRRQKRATTPSVLGVSWFDPVQYQRLLEVAADRPTLYDRYEDWLANIEQTVARINQPFERVFIDVEVWAAWSRAQDLPLDGSSRSRYVAEVLRERSKGPGSH